MNTLLVVLQIVLLSALLIREISRSYRANLAAVLFFGMSLLLVQLQSLVVSQEIERSGTVYYLNHRITEDGLTLANLLLTISTLLVFCTYLGVSIHQPPNSKRKIDKKQSVISPPNVSYLLVGVLIAGATIILVHLLGGVEMALLQPGRMVGGQTLLLVAIGLGKMPLLYNTALFIPPTRTDWLLFIFTALLTLLNSRQLALFSVAQYLIIHHYSERQPPLRKLTIFSAIAIAISLGYGSIRHYTNFYSAYNLDDLANFYQGFDAVDFFFRLNIEAFSGFAGIMTAYNEGRLTHHDLAISNLLILTHVFPYSIRQGLLYELDAWLNEIYPYRGSIVPSGFEAAFAHFGVPGVILLALVLGVLPWWLHAKLTSGSSRSRVIYGLVAVDSLRLLIAPLWMVLFFALADIVTVVAYNIILSVSLAIVKFNSRSGI